VRAFIWLAGLVGDGAGANAVSISSLLRNTSVFNDAGKQNIHLKDAALAK
jgi:hypothetical protein